MSVWRASVCRPCRVSPSIFCAAAMKTRRHASYDVKKVAADGQKAIDQEEEDVKVFDQRGDDASSGGSEDESSSNDDDASSSSSSSSDDDEDETAKDSPAAVSQEEIQHAIALASDAARKTFGWDANATHNNTTKKNKRKVSSKFGGPGEGNALSDLIPGYTAPMRLEVTYAKSDGITANGASDRAVSMEESLQELRRRAQRTDRSTAAHVASSTAQSTRADAMRQRRPGSGGAPSFKMGTKRGPDGTAGRGWFGMAPAALTDDVRADIAIIRNRTYLDPKRFYKKADIMDPKLVQVGTVIEGSEEYYSSRLTKKQRRQNLAEEIMADSDVKKYAKTQFSKIQDSKQRRFGQGYGRKKQRTGRKGRR